MKKINDEASAVGIVIIIFTSLIFSTVMISWFMLQMYGVSIAGIDLPTSAITYNSNQDFTTNSINISTYVTRGEDEWIYNSGVGRVLSKAATQGYFSQTWNFLMLNNIQKNSNGDIINKYSINNSVKGDYTIIIRFTGGDDQIEFKIKDDGLYEPFYAGYFVQGMLYETKLQSYPNMNKVKDVTIITKYNEDDYTCDFTFNGITYTITDLQERRAGFNYISPNYYGGVASDVEGFTVKSITSNNAIIDESNSSITTQLAAFLVIAFKLVAFNISPDLLPWEINILLIKTQCLALLVGLINFGRGVS